MGSYHVHVPAEGKGGRGSRGKATFIKDIAQNLLSVLLLTSHWPEYHSMAMPCKEEDWSFAAAAKIASKLSEARRGIK